MKLRSAKLLAAVGAVLFLGFGLTPGIASAASTCTYPATTCSAPSNGSDGGAPVVSTSADGDGDGGHTTASALAFTGADIEQMVVIALACIGAGGLLLRRSRRRRSAQG